jgi:N5-(cytidine 5'-diphosphoramidyl)-L-glutamine hydrolase
MKPIIGISLRITNAEKYVEKRDSISHDWPILLEKLGFSPLLIPNAISNIPEFLDEMKISGLILSGGDNIGDDIIRDKTENDILNYAISHNVPLIGVCRGMQIINSFFGGKTQFLNNTNHVNKSHTVNINNHFSFQNNTIEVNSFHHNVIDKLNLGKNLSSFAISKNDNTIEGLIHNELSIIGVMWHPERNPDINSHILLKNFFLK